ncbi:helix-turn-helix domain-containing protein [Geothrix fermentans]|uniref:helix-turn-helix domain-containing protein n=1 Tax=Geothrix fermentans TaxID=44676 RepID=UPI0005BA44A4|nr:helix-turn-helix transcriptional regulator [Geothrix fermentans]
MTSGRVVSKAKVKSSQPSTLGQRIRAVRRAWGWTQTTLAEALGSAQSMVSEWEKDVSRPSGAALISISRLFRLPVEALVQGKGFTLPEAPGQSSGAAMSKRDIQDLRHLLPQLQQGEILQVDTQAEDAALVQLSQALQVIREAKRQGRQVWLVIGDKTKPKD